jgi:deazaflavin-dependent oxidoreductase (nitroreductase family)
MATAPGASGPQPRNLSLWFDRTVGRKLYPWHVRVYRMTGGVIGHRSAMGPMLLLTTTGRTSGQPRTTPLLYLPDGQDFFVMGSNGARDTDPNWLRNLEVDPRATVQAGRRIAPVTAQVLRGAAREEVWPRLTAFYAGWARYQEQTAREIPAVHLVAAR